MDYEDLRVLLRDIDEKLLQNIENNYTTDYKIIKKSCKQLAKDLNLSQKELRELCLYIKDYIFLLVDYRHIYAAFDEIFHLMKRSDLPSVSKVVKQIELREKLKQIDSDFV